MAEDKSTSLINLGELSRPANTLIKKVSSAIGGLFEPLQVKRMAKAEAEAGLIRARADIEITDLHRRALHRFLEEEARRQENMEEITKKSLSHLDEESNPDDMEDDWVTNFFEKSRIISDEDMQAIWARVLSGEANSPGSYAKRTVNILADLDKRDAELFHTLCRFIWVIGDITPLVFDPQAEIYNRLGINFGSLTHLDSLGLIKFSGIGGFARQNLPKRFVVTYCGQPLQLTMENNKRNTLEVGDVLFTQAGKELARVTNSPRVEGLFDYVKERWKAYLPEENDT